MCNRYQKSGNSTVTVTEELFTSEEPMRLAFCDDRRPEGQRSPEITREHFNCRKVSESNKKDLQWTFGKDKIPATKGKSK